MAIDTAGSQTEKRTSKKDDQSFIVDCREKLDQSYNYERENRREAAMDMAFVAGYQWPESIRKERQAAGRPILTINRLPQFIRQVTNDIRQSDLAIKVSPVDDQSDPKVAKIYNGLLRQIHYQSNGKAVYATAGEHQVACGIGWFRIVSEYADDEVFDQELRLKAIRNPLSVYCDPAAVEPDRSDMNWCFVSEVIPTADFKRKYPKAALNGVDPPVDGTGDRLTWLTRDGVRVAEYWCKKPVKKTLGMLQSGETLDVTKIAADMQKLLGVAKTREVDAHEVEMYVISGSEILEGPHKWAGKWIPLVPVIGSEVPLETAVVRHGLVRFARDPQQLYNYNRTAAAETLALQPKSPWLVTMKMVAKVKSLWDGAHRNNYPYLPYEADPDLPGGPKRLDPPQMSVAFVKEAELADQDMKATTGIYDASLGGRSNETSGIAIRNRERQGDTANYHYGDNLQRSMWHAGRILIDLIPKVYDNERVIRCLGEDDSVEHHKINQVVMGVDGLPVTLNDLSAGRFDIRATIGASYSTKRQEAADTLLEYLKMDQQAVPMVRDLVAKNFDWPVAEEMAKRFKNSIPPALLVDPEDKNAPPPPPPPNPLDDPTIRAEIMLKESSASLNFANAGKIRLESERLASTPIEDPNTKHALALHKHESGMANANQQAGEDRALAAQQREETPQGEAVSQQEMAEAENGPPHMPPEQWLGAPPPPPPMPNGGPPMPQPGMMPPQGPPGMPPNVQAEDGPRPPLRDQRPPQ